MPKRKRTISPNVSEKQAIREKQLSLKELPEELSLESILDYAKKQILDQAPKVLPGEAKMMIVIDQVVRWVDDQIDYEKLGVAGKVLDAIDHVLLKIILKFVIQSAYNELSERGLV